jgi:hypothetical protein
VEVEVIREFEWNSKSLFLKCGVIFGMWGGLGTERGGGGRGVGT